MSCGFTDFACIHNLIPFFFILQELYPSILLFIPGRKAKFIFDGGPSVQQLLEFIFHQGSIDIEILHMLHGSFKFLSICLVLTTVSSYLYIFLYMFVFICVCVRALISGCLLAQRSNICSSYCIKNISVGQGKKSKDIAESVFLIRLLIRYPFIIWRFIFYASQQIRCVRYPHIQTG